MLFCKKELNCIKVKKIVLSLLYYFWEKNAGIENMYKTRKKATKYHVDPCYYAMLLGRNVLWFISEGTSSRSEVLCKKGVLTNFAKFTGKRLCQSLLFNKVADLRSEACNYIKKETQVAQVFPYGLCEISKNTFLHRTHLVVALRGASFVKLYCITLG